MLMTKLAEIEVSCQKVRRLKKLFVGPLNLVRGQKSQILHISVQLQPVELSLSAIAVIIVSIVMKIFHLHPIPMKTTMRIMSTKLWLMKLRILWKWHVKVRDNSLVPGDVTPGKYRGRGEY